ncbi:M23 family metallopeptidase [Streptomyces tubbatahanensis]|uniref:M23 family metallopeptidase n=1 Tax=Streptomyces tubbatahanensis TaxID=2923272 RepID=A0ABY3XRZ7_9ACTN|nr:M23 family metallopeptidase [Streptomyces tubbatahanensis]UNS97165.1 M23 family metallopeptidase [Streptomyces tubbatahanensis]
MARTTTDGDRAPGGAHPLTARGGRFRRAVAGAAAASAVLLAAPGLPAAGPSGTSAVSAAPGTSAVLAGVGAPRKAEPPPPDASSPGGASGQGTGAGADAADAGGSAGTVRWVRPIALEGVRVSQAYGVKGDWAAGHHTGIDLAVPEGTGVRSVGPGTVVFAGWSGDYGKAVTVRMTDGRYTLFAHLSHLSVAAGDTVHPGTPLGRSGNTGRSTGPHLHFEVRAARGYGSDIDPVRYLAGHGVRLV